MNDIIMGGWGYVKGCHDEEGLKWPKKGDIIFVQHLYIFMRFSCKLLVMKIAFGHRKMCGLLTLTRRRCLALIIPNLLISFW